MIHYYFLLLVGILFPVLNSDIKGGVYILGIYLICYDFPTDKQSIPSTNNFFQSIGDHCRLLESASLLATELDTQEIHEEIRDYTDINGEWTISKVDKSFTGNSDNVEVVIAFMKLHNFKDD